MKCPFKPNKQPLSVWCLEIIPVISHYHILQKAHPESELFKPISELFSPHYLAALFVCFQAHEASVAFLLFSLTIMKTLSWPVCLANQPVCCWFFFFHTGFLALLCGWIFRLFSYLHSLGFLQEERTNLNWLSLTEVIISEWEMNSGKKEFS